MSTKSDAMLPVFFLIFAPCVMANVALVDYSAEDTRINLIIDIIALNLKNNGWNNIITYGHLTDIYYNKIKKIPFTFVTSNTDEDDYYVDGAVPYHSNTIVIDCSNFTHLEESFRQVMQLPYWHPHANIIILYHEREINQNIALIFFIMWYYRASNAILIQFDDKKKLMTIFQYNPFVVDDSTESFGCRTVRTIGLPINTFKEAFVCEQNCQNVSITSKHRHLRLGTCIGLYNYEIPYENKTELTKLNLFEDRGKNMNGFALRAFATEIPPFLFITPLDNGKYKLDSRDGTIWNTLATLMNFTIELSIKRELLKKFDFEVNIQQIFSVGHRKGDLFLIPIYQFDIIVIELDYSFAYRDSGVCFMSHKAPFETIMFDFKTLQDNTELLIKFAMCVLCIWMVFIIYSFLETDNITVDLVGKNFMNTIRSVLSINLYKPPNIRSFRYFLTIIVWSFFVLNFSTQAAITSFFTAFKRGKDVETYADIVEKGYKIQGMSSPDVVLPDDKELFRKINSKLEPINTLFQCVEALKNDSHLFCLIDCSVGRYLARNWLNDNGKQYLHISTDRVHNYYLNFVFPRHSVLTDMVNKYLLVFYEAGLVKKWEQYRFNDIKDEAPVKPLGMEEFQGVINAYLGLVFVTVLIFFIELLIGNYKKMKQHCSLKVKIWKRTRVARRIIKLERKQNKITNVSSSTQTCYNTHVA